MLCLLSFSVAFGIINHCLLLDHLHNLWVGSPAFCSACGDGLRQQHWMTAFRTPDSYAVVCCKESSSQFTIYTKLLGVVLRGLGAKHFQYIDDTQLSFCHVVTSESGMIQGWCLEAVVVSGMVSGSRKTANMLQLNPDKTEALEECTCSRQGCTPPEGM